MNKCKNCGTEFEGKFCPECGEKAELKAEAAEDFDGFGLDEILSEENKEKPVSAEVDKKTAFKLAYLSKVSRPFLSFLASAFFLMWLASLVLILKDSRNFSISSGGVEEVLTGTPSLKSLNVRLYFADGSLINKVIDVDVDTSTKGTKNVNWSDTYGTHTVKVYVN